VAPRHCGADIPNPGHGRREQHFFPVVATHTSLRCLAGNADAGKIRDGRVLGRGAVDLHRE
jgi:hypothetical protein